MKVVKKIPSIFLLILILAEIFVLCDIFNTQYYTPSYHNTQLKNKYPQIEQYKTIFLESLPLVFLSKEAEENLIPSKEIQILGFTNCKIEVDRFSMGRIIKSVKNSKETFSAISIDFLKNQEGWLPINSKVQNYKQDPYILHKLKLNTFRRVFVFIIAIASILFSVFTSFYCFFKEEKFKFLWLFLLWIVTWNCIKFNLTTENWAWCFSREPVWNKSSPYDPYFIFIKFPIVEMVYWLQVFVRSKRSKVCRNN